MTIKTKVCEVYAVDVTIDYDASEYDCAEIAVTRIKNFGARELQELIDAAPAAHKEAILNTLLDADDRVTLALDWCGV